MSQKLKKARDWYRYGKCPKCHVRRGQACWDLRTLQDVFAAHKQNPHKERERLFGEKREGN